MEINLFIKSFADQFDDVAIESLTPATIIREVEGWSSIVALSIIAMVDEEYNVMLTGADIRNSKTIEELFSIVVSRQK